MKAHKKLDPRTLFTIKGAVTPDKRKQFAGRDKLIEKSLDALAIEESPLILFGERGVGKTSLGWQLLGILGGSSGLLEERDIRPYFDVEIRKCVWLTCTKYMADVHDVVLSIFNQAKPGYSFQDHFPRVFKDGSFIDRVKQKYKLKAGFFEAEFEVPPSEPPNDVVLDENRDLRAFSALREVLDKVNEVYPKDRVLIFLDEYDQVRGPTGVGILLKTINQAQFVVIGIADSVEILIGEHPSIDRKLTEASFEVPLLTKNQINWFFDQIEAISNGRVEFNDHFREAAIQESSGFPWLVQQFGFYALADAVRDQEVRYHYEVTRHHFDNMIERLVRGELGDAEFSIRRMNKTEKAILNVLVGTRNGRMLSDELNTKIHRRFRTYYDRARTKLEKGKIIEKVGSEIRFSDPITKILVGIAMKNGLLDID